MFLHRITYLKKKYHLAIGENMAEKVKVQIGSAYPLPDGEETMDVKGRDVVDGLPKTLRISSEEVRSALDEPVRLIMQALRQALEKTPPELASDIVDRGVVMTGGGSLLRGLDQRIREETNLPVYVVDDPLTCVVMGAGKIINDTARYSKLLARERKAR